MAASLRFLETIMSAAPLHPFHLAFPVNDLAAARTFYGGLLGCPEGRSSPDWIDFNFYGHQIVAHLAPGETTDVAANAVDGHGVPVRHFGVVLSMEEWEAAAEKLTKANIEFVIKPYIRFRGEPGEQATMFFKDPSGNAIEMKAFADINSLFAK
jgi:extradiol dioxygenase family protein